MSRIGKQNIIIPEKTDVSISDGIVRVKGPLGELSRSVRDEISIEVVDGAVVVNPKRKTKFTHALWGTYASHIKNMIHGVNTAFEKKLVVEGVGFKVSTTGDTLTLSVGFSHTVELTIPENVTVSVEKNVISISSPDKEAVGAFAAKVRAKKKPEPYKGKGIRYEDETVRRKQGKRATAA